MITKQLPLTDLHRHLDGNIRIQTILDLGQSLDRTHDWLASGRQALKLVGLDKGKPHTHPELGGFAAAWSNIAASITDTDIPEEKSRSNPILFASNLGNFDAVCIRDKSDRFAVGFDLGFLRGLDQLAHVISFVKRMGYPWILLRRMGYI